MLDYDRTDISEVIDIYKTGGLGESISCHCWFVLGINFRFPPKICDDCHMIYKSVSFNDVALVASGRNDYRINFWFMTKKEAVDRMENADLS